MATFGPSRYLYQNLKPKFTNYYRFPDMILLISKFPPNIKHAFANLFILQVLNPDTYDSFIRTLEMYKHFITN